MEAATAEKPSAPARMPVPDPGEPVPQLAWPTLAIFFGALAVWAVATWAALGGHAPWWTTIPVHAAVSFVMFTVLHDATHYAMGRTRWVNGLFGRLAMPFVAAYASFPMIAFIHIQHHRNANESPQTDPDAWTEDGPWWQLPFRWLTIDVAYARYYLARRRQRPHRETAETAATMLLFSAAVGVAAATGHLWEAALVYLIPQRIALGTLAWWFDWLPHHGLDATQKENRYRATRVRVGLEQVMTPLMLSQNYHLVHHLHPSIPFYRYLAAWRRNEDVYVDNGAAIATVTGQLLTPDEYRVWRHLDSPVDRLRRVRAPQGSSSPHGVFYRLRVADLERLTDDSVAITFDVPEEMEGLFRFTQGQHVTVRTDLGGEGVRRNYSIAAPATTGPLRIAVKRIEGGAFSSFAMEELEVGDELELMTPTGRFSTQLDPTNCRHYVAIAVGSGITPILSILATTLEVEADSRFTLIYGNRSRATTMFRDELEDLLHRYADRLVIHHVLSREEQRDPQLSGRIDREKLDAWLGGELDPDDVDEWFLCGPLELVEVANEALTEHRVEPAHVHMELFFADAGDGEGSQAGVDRCELTFSLGGEDETLELRGGQTVLEAALEARDDAPYSCMGGVCGTCRAKLLEGDVEMDHNMALGQDDLDAGYVLTCQAHPTTETVKVDYDA